MNKAELIEKVAGETGLTKAQTEKVRNILGSGYENAFHNQSTTSYLQMLDQIFVKNL